MLVIVLVLVLAAFALLLMALLGSSTLWAWLSVAVSLLAATLLAVDWWRRRRAARVAEQEYWDSVPGAGVRVESAQPAESDGPGDPEPESDRLPDRDIDDTEPDEEQTDAADVLAVSELDSEVLVIDERPRYHLASCDWLAGRPTMSLPVWEARELGFTPCARCTPDRRLVAQHRSGTTR